MFAVNLTDNKTKEDLIEELKQVFEGMGYTFLNEEEWIQTQEEKRKARDEMVQRELRAFYRRKEDKGDLS